MDHLVIVTRVNRTFSQTLPIILDAYKACSEGVRIGGDDIERQVDLIRQFANAIADGINILQQNLLQDSKYSAFVQDVVHAADRSPPMSPIRNLQCTKAAARKVFGDVSDLIKIHLQEELSGVLIDDEQQAKEAVELAIRVQHRMSGLAQALGQSGHQEPFQGRAHCLAEVSEKTSQPLCMHPTGISVQARRAPVAERAHNKYLGDHKFVRDLLGVIDESSCLAVGSKYAVQVLAIKRQNKHFEWFPGITTTFQHGDTVYYAGFHGRGDLSQFEKDVVQGAAREEETFEMVELIGYVNGEHVGAPPHIWDCVIGGSEHRDSQQKKGALYFRKTFGNIAIHLIVRRNGTRVEFPGPWDDFQQGDRIYTVCRIANRSGRQVNALILNEPESLEVLLSRDRFLSHVDELNAKCDPELRVIPPAGGWRSTAHGSN